MITIFVNYKLYFRRKVHFTPFMLDDKYGCHGENLSTEKIGYYDAQIELCCAVPLTYHRN